MEVTNNELLHIAKLADLNIKTEEIEKYLSNLTEIINFANTVNEAQVEELKETASTNTNYNVFRKDEIHDFEDKEALLQNAPECENHMFKIPKVIN